MKDKRTIIKEVWLTKYALTNGVERLENVEDVGDGMIADRKSGGWTNHYHGREWHRSHADAVADVLSRIAAKRKSIAKTLAKLDKLEAKYRASVQRGGGDES